jgi:hypothetical protein
MFFKHWKIYAVFHNTDHDKKLEDVIKFLGCQNSEGAFDVLYTATYKKCIK